MIDIRIANTMGLDISNAQHSVAIKEAIYGIVDTEAFLEFCKDKKNSIDYETKTEKLMTLSGMYKKTYCSSSTSLRSSYLFFKNIFHIKLNRLENIVDEKSVAFSMIAIDGEKFFTQKELNALQGIGSISYIIECSRTNTLQEQLQDLFLGKFVAKSRYEALGDNKKKVLGMINKTLKREGV